MSVVVREAVFDMMDMDDDEDEMKDDKGSFSGSKWKSVVDESKFQSSPRTPTSVLLDFSNRKSMNDCSRVTCSAPLLLPLRVKAIEKLSPVDLKSMCFHMYPNSLSRMVEAKRGCEVVQECVVQVDNGEGNPSSFVRVKMEVLENTSTSHLGELGSVPSSQLASTDMIESLPSPLPLPLPPPPPSAPLVIMSNLATAESPLVATSTIATPLPPLPPSMSTSCVARPLPSPSPPQPPPPPPIASGNAKITLDELAPHPPPESIPSPSSPMQQGKRGAPPPPPPPPAPRTPGSIPLPPSSLQQGKGGAPPPPSPPPALRKPGCIPPLPPPPPMQLGKGGAPSPPPPPAPKQPGGGAPPPPPPLGGAKSLRAKATAKLKRSSQMGSLYRLLKGKIEGSSLKGKSIKRIGSKIGASSGANGKQGMADALAEMTKRSSYFQQIEEDVNAYANSIKEVQAALSSFQTTDMAELTKFHKYVESHLEKLTDETQVLVRFENFPSKKLEALRMAAALYAKLETMATTLQNWNITSPVTQVLDKVENYFNKIKVQLDALERTKDDELKKFNSQKIHFDFGILVRIKELLVEVSSNCMELALKETREASAKDKEGKGKNGGKRTSTGKILWRAFQFAFRVYTFAGGQDDRADNLTRELAQEIQTDTQQ